MIAGYIFILWSVSWMHRFSWSVNITHRYTLVNNMKSLTVLVITSSVLIVEELSSDNILRVFSSTIINDLYLVILCLVAMELIYPSNLGSHLCKKLNNWSYYTTARFPRFWLAERWETKCDIHCFGHENKTWYWLVLTSHSIQFEQIYAGHKHT